MPFLGSRLLKEQWKFYLISQEQPEGPYSSNGTWPRYVLLCNKSSPNSGLKWLFIILSHCPLG